MSYASQLRAFASVSFLTVPFYVPLLALLVFTYNTYSLGIALILFVPTLAAQRLLHLYQQEKEAARHLAAANSRSAYREPPLHDGSRRDLRGERLLYRRSLPRGRDIRTRHR